MFISSYYDRSRDHVLVWERTPDGRRVVRDHKCVHYFYVPSRSGDYEAITGERLEKLVFDSRSEFDQAVLSHPKRFESDLSPLEKCMMDNYAGVDPPRLVYGFLDIEVDYDPNVGFPRPSNPYAPINAVTVYRSDTEEYVTYAVPPPGWTASGSDLPDDMESDGYFLCADERELVSKMLDAVQPIDVLSGWNSEFFDLPYIGKRVEMLFGRDGLRRLGFERSPPPRWSEAERFKGGAKEMVLEIGSRVHLDYMRVFKKFNLEGRQSYSLAAIANDELDVPKLHYDGSLYELYRGLWRPNLDSLKPEAEWTDLYAAQVQAAAEPTEENRQLVARLTFLEFCRYNRRDVEVIVKLDKKFKYLEQANGMVHEATVNFNAIFGSVQLIDTAIINFCHRELEKIVFDKTHRPGQKVEGALVMSPVIGLHRKIGSVDIQSLYPSTYRTLNLSPEKIVGQLMGYEDDWRKIYQANKDPSNEALQNKTVIFRLEGADPSDDIVLTAREMIDLSTSKKFAVSGYGTVLDQSGGEGLLPAVLSYWFNGRIEMKTAAKKHSKDAESILKSNGGDKKDPSYVQMMAISELYDLRQGIRKTLLNSAYGATLNSFCRFHDPRLGASTTGSGRQITTHMIETIASSLIGENSPKIKKTVEYDKTGEAINTYTMDCPPGIGPIYSDTDSAYFVMDTICESMDEAVVCADAIADAVNASFPGFIREAFLCQPEFSNKIKAVREMVAHSGIFRAKKKYVMFVYDMEGKRPDPDSSKAMKTQGSDIKLSSTPETVREMLRSVTMMVLKGEDREKIDDYILEFRKNLSSGSGVNVLEFATVTSVKTYDEYYEKWARIEKPGLGRVTMPANVRSAINYNHFVSEKGITEAQAIRAGDKIKMLWLRTNEWGFTNFAFGSDVEELPAWFTRELEVDLKVTEQKLVDQKLLNVFEPLGWQVPTERTKMMGKLVEF